MSIGQISFACSKCGAKLKASDRKTGHSFPCPKCSTVVTVPSPETAIISRPAPPPPIPEVVTTRRELEARIQPIVVMAPSMAEVRPIESSRSDEVESTLLQLNPSMWRMSPVSVVISSLLVPVFGVGLLNLIPWWLRCRGTTLIVTNRRTTLRTGILSKSTTEVWHRDIRNVQVTQSLFQRMMNVGKIGISSAANSGMEIEIDGIANPEGVRKVIDTHRMR